MPPVIFLNSYLSFVKINFNRRLFFFFFRSSSASSSKSGARIISENNFHNNDICFLSSKINILRSLDFEFRSQHIPTKTNFETQEIFNALITQYPSNVEHLKTHLKTVRNNKKFHFWMNDGNMKLSTIHSFK